jgi:hypothetical protein
VSAEEYARLAPLRAPDAFQIPGPYNMLQAPDGPVTVRMGHMGPVPDTPPSNYLSLYLVLANVLQVGTAILTHALLPRDRIVDYLSSSRVFL